MNNNNVRPSPDTCSTSYYLK